MAKVQAVISIILTVEQAGEFIAIAIAVQTYDCIEGSVALQLAVVRWHKGETWHLDVRDAVAHAEAAFSGGLVGGDGAGGGDSEE